MAESLKRLIVVDIVPPLAIGVLRWNGRSWRVRETRPEILRDGTATGRPLVGAFFHGRLFQLAYHMGRAEGCRWLAMCSKSLEGEAMSRVARALGYDVVRGSSGRGGVEALVGMIRAARRDPAVFPCLAVDGSVGPRHVVQPGVVTLASKTGGLILPVAASARPAVTFTRAWDRAAVPLPFARVHVVYGELIEAPRGLDPAGTEAIRARLERDMLALHREADALSGYRS